MGLLSIFKRPAATTAKATAAGDASDAVQKARTRARQRLIGAAVLVGIGVIGFPLVFETQPRPIPVDIPIEVPRKDGAPPLVMPAARAPTTAPAPASASAVVRPAAESPPTAPPEARNKVITESREEAGRELPASSPAAAPVARAASQPAVKAAAAAIAEAPPAKPAAPGNDGARAKALLDGKPPGAADSGRFVVQVGAFADAGAARDTRLKVEKLGLKTYTQVASTAAGDRIRVRVGPFATRDEADRALAKARGAGLSAVVLTL